MGVPRWSRHEHEPHRRARDVAGQRAVVAEVLPARLEVGATSRAVRRCVKPARRRTCSSSRWPSEPSSPRRPTRFAWHVSNFATLPDPREDDGRSAAWPPLRKLTGKPFTPEDASGDGVLSALLLEVFPQAFRRLEYLFSSLEVPTSIADWDIPHAATPRWFWIHGFGETGVKTTFEGIANAEWPGPDPPSIARFLKGLAPIFVEAGTRSGRRVRSRRSASRPRVRRDGTADRSGFCVRDIQPPLPPIQISPR